VVTNRTAKKVIKCLIFLTYFVGKNIILKPDRGKHSDTFFF
jgi:hypothetical protein